MSELINEHIKNEFKRFFEYAFKCNSQYWQGLSGWEVLSKIRTPEEDRLFNKLVTKVIQSEDSLKRIINDASLNFVRELKYYAYLFLKDMGRAEGIPEPKLPETPPQFIGLVGAYDNPNRLMDMVKNPTKPSDIRQQALNRLKELVPWNKLPATIFDREIFTREKWADWMVRSGGIDGRGEYKNIDRNFYIAKILGHAKGANWAAVNLYAEGYMLAVGAVPTVTLPAPTSPTKQPCAPRPAQWPSNIKYGHPAGMRAYQAELDRYNREKAACDQASAEYERARVAYNSALAEYNNVAQCSGYISQVWAKYRKEQDIDFPTQWAQYERALEAVTFPDSGLVKAEDLYTGTGYMVLKNKLGEAKVKELWNSSEKLLQAIEGKFSGECKNIFANRLYDIAILTLGEQKRVIAGLLEIHEDMFFGESFGPVPVVDTRNVTIVDKNMLGNRTDEINETNKTNKATEKK